MADSKLREISPGIYVGSCGDGHLGSLLYAYLEKNSLSQVESAIELADFFKDFAEWAAKYLELHPEKPGTLYGSQFIIVIYENAWIFNNYYIRNLKEGDFSAIGAGAQAGLACMYIGASVEEALEAVCKVDIYCSEPIKIFEIGIKHE